MSDPPLQKIEDRAANRHVLVLTPVYNDWESLGLLLPKLDAALAQAGWTGELLAVDDGSTAEADEHLRIAGLTAVQRVEVLRLRRNLGHQRALCVAVPFVVERGTTASAVAVMDSDGEDRPEDVPTLLSAMAGSAAPRIVFALRQRRSEGLVFRVGYWWYRRLFGLLTGLDIRVGNFSVMPTAMLERAAVLSELWNHYAAGLIKSRLPWTAIPLDRGVRLAGRSQMNLVSLTAHGLSAISVHAETVGTRLLIAVGVVASLAFLAAAAVVVIRLSTDWAIPGWATFAFGLSALAVLQMLTVAFVTVLMVLHGRSQMGFLPLRDYKWFVRDCRVLSPTEPNASPRSALPT